MHLKHLAHTKVSMWVLVAQSCPTLCNPNREHIHHPQKFLHAPSQYLFPILPCPTSHLQETTELWAMGFSPDFLRKYPEAAL